MASRKIIPVDTLPKVELTNKENVLQALDSTVVSAIMGVLTIYALFGDDIRVSLFNKAADTSFEVISTIGLLAFLIELSASMYAKTGYTLSFFWTLDAVSTLSLIPDIPWLYEGIVGAEDTNAGDSATLKAGRASRAGTKAGRIVRIVRLVRMVRIVRLFKMKSDKDKKVVTQISEPSKVGKILTEQTTQKLILLVLSMVIIFPLLDGSLDEDYNEYQQYGLQNLHHYSQSMRASPDYDEMLKKHTLHYARNAGPLLLFELSGVSKVMSDGWLKNMKFQALDEYDEMDTTLDYTLSTHPIHDWTAASLLENEVVLSDILRASEYSLIEDNACYDADGHINGEFTCKSTVYFDTKTTSQNAAALSLLKTIFIMAVLVIGTVFFSKIAQEYVIGPIERMFNLVKKLAENPLGNTKTEKDEFEPVGDYETVMLENTLSKIGGLLQVGFGVAGTEIISKNMGGAGELEVMLAGKKITSIFGFGIIEGFTEMCSLLEEDIITYINTIASIIHSDTNSYYGAANKNIGSAFLLAWKICDGTLPGLRDPRDPVDKPTLDADTKALQRKNVSVMGYGDGNLEREIGPMEMVDSALTAMLKMRIDIHEANQRPRGAFVKFSNHEKVKAEFGPAFEVHLGFGMHIGWAIEGAIGSKYKIDASYLSPNVNMAARLEAATGQFDVPMLLSEWFVSELSPAAKNRCRKIDRVCVKGSAIPMELWTFDIGTVPDSFKPLQDTINGTQLPVNFESDLRYQALQAGIDPMFQEKFKTGVEYYLAGQWLEAKHEFEQCLELRGDDGPTKLHMKNLAALDFTAPADWAGWRALTEK